MVVLAVRLEMIGEIGDPLSQDCDLDLWRAGIARLGRIFLDELLPALSADRHRVILAVRGLSGPGRDVVQHGRLKSRWADSIGSSAPTKASWPPLSASDKRVASATARSSPKAPTRVRRKASTWPNESSARPTSRASART